MGGLARKLLQNIVAVRLRVAQYGMLCRGVSPSARALVWCVKCGSLVYFHTNLTCQVNRRRSAAPQNKPPRKPWRTAIIFRRHLYLVRPHHRAREAQVRTVLILTHATYLRARRTTRERVQANKYAHTVLSRIDRARVLA